MLSTKASGSVTVYLTVTLTVILSLIFCVIESARLTSMKVRAGAITYTALDSAFSHFALPLYDKYGIFGVFGTEADFLSTVKDYAEKNGSPQNLPVLSSFNLTRLTVDDIKYNNIYHLTDMDGAIFAKQAVAFEKYRALPAKLKQLSEAEDALGRQTASKPADISGSTITVSGSDINAMEKLSKGDSPLYKDISRSDAKNLKEGIISKVSELIKSNLLLLFFDDPYSISHIELEEEAIKALPSSVCTLSETAKAIQSGSLGDDSNAVASLVDKSLFLSYMYNSFDSYAESHSGKQKNPDISLKYQREYILCGNSSDDANLLSSALSIVSLRAGFNLTYLLSDSAKRGAAYNLAGSVCGHIPVATHIGAFIILSAWAYAEGIIDARDLFQGKKVPLMKSDDNWTLSPHEIITLGKSTVSANDGNSGYSYEEYLDICLFAQSPYSLYYRTMDLIQLDLCENYNPGFQMAACITGADINIRYDSDSLFTSIIMLGDPAAYSYGIDMLYGYD